MPDTEILPIILSISLILLSFFSFRFLRESDYLLKQLDLKYDYYYLN